MFDETRSSQVFHFPRPTPQAGVNKGLKRTPTPLVNANKRKMKGGEGNLETALEDILDEVVSDGDNDNVEGEEEEEPYSGKTTR